MIEDKLSLESIIELSKLINFISSSLSNFRYKEAILCATRKLIKSSLSSVETFWKYLKNFPV